MTLLASPETSGPPAIAEPAPDPRPGRAVVRLAVTEARLLVIHPAFVTGVVIAAFLAWLTGPDGVDDSWHSRSILTPLLVAPLGWLTIVAAHLNALRPRRRDTEEMFEAAPLSTAQQTLAHVLAALGTAPVTAALMGGLLAYQNHVEPAVGGSVHLGELGVGVLLVVGGGVVGVAVARWLPHPIAALPAVMAVIAIEIALTETPSAPHRFLAFLVGDELDILPHLEIRPWAWHLVWLIAWTGVMGVVGVARHRIDRPVVAAALVCALLVGLSGWGQLRPLPGSVADAKAAWLLDPLSVQRCEARGELRFCAYPGELHLVDEWATVVAGVLDAVPADVAARVPVVTQRVPDLAENPDCGDTPFLDMVHPDIRDRLSPEQVWPRDGGIHPTVGPDHMPCGGQRLNGLFTAVQTGAWAVGLPPTPWHLHERCIADGQARSALALWLGAQATPNGRSALRLVRQEAPFDASSRLAFGDESLQMHEGAWDVVPQWGVRWHRADMEAALALLGRPHAEVVATVIDSWDVLVDPATPTSTLLEAAGATPFATPAPQTDCPTSRGEVS